MSQTTQQSLPEIAADAGCPTCGEQLTGETPRGRRCCPECGTVHPDDQRPTPHWEGRL